MQENMGDNKIEKILVRNLNDYFKKENLGGTGNGEY